MIEKYSRVYASVDLDAILYNMEQMRKNMESETKMIAVIKTDGYGHGAVPIARVLEPLSYVCGFAVATIEEALILRKSGITKPVLILGYTFPYCYEEMIQEEIRPAVFEWESVEKLAACAEKINRQRKQSDPSAKEVTVKVHIKVDTGMSRIGIRPDGEGLAFVKRVMETSGIEVEGIFTHFARADETEKGPAVHQLQEFKEFISEIESETGRRIPVCHCSNSAGILEMREANMDVVRAGISMYGLWPSDEVEKDIVILHPAMELKSRVVYVKEVPAGTEVSYGGTFTAKRPTKVATVPIGYGDGYPRGLSNRGYVLIRGEKAPVIGRICMDQFMVDVTDIKGAAAGDTVTLIGKDGERKITMEELGKLSGRFNYELACLIGKRVPRVYIKEGKTVGTKDYFQDFD